MKDLPDRRILIGVAAAALLVLSACDRGAEAPTTDQPSVATAPAEEAKAEEVATGFLAAFGAFDVDQARTYWPTTRRSRRWARTMIFDC